MLALAVANYPANGRTKDVGFRSMVVEFDEMANWNVSGTATQKAYEFHYKLKTLPAYFVTSSVSVITPTPNVTISNLLSDEVISLRVAFRPTAAALKESDYSQWYDYSVKKASLAGGVIVPGEVQNLKAEVNSDTNSTHSVIITFDDPANIQSATTDNDKSIQYMVGYCTYNRFTKKESDCKTLTVFLRNTTASSQTTLNFPNMYTSNVHPPKNLELVFKVTGVSLNGTSGTETKLVKRLDPATKPDAPSNLNSTDIYASQLELTMTSKYDTAGYYVEYNNKGNATKVLLSFGAYGKTPSFKITGLKALTEYEFRAGLIKGGGSEWSALYTVKTSNITMPTPSPAPSSSNMLTSSFVTAIVAMASFLLVLSGSK